MHELPFDTVLIANRGRSPSVSSRPFASRGFVLRSSTTTLMPARLRFPWPMQAPRSADARRLLPISTSSRLSPPPEKRTLVHCIQVYGFPSENAEVARAVTSAGIIGPAPESIELMGDKIRARTFVQRQGFPVPPCAIEEDAPAPFVLRARAMGLPLLVKPSAGRRQGHADCARHRRPEGRNCAGAQRGAALLRRWPILHRTIYRKPAPSRSPGAGRRLRKRYSSRYVAPNSGYVTVQPILSDIIQCRLSVLRQFEQCDATHDSRLLKTLGSGACRSATFSSARHLRVGRTSLSIGDVEADPAPDNTLRWVPRLQSERGGMERGVWTVAARSRPLTVLVVMPSRVRT